MNLYDKALMQAPHLLPNHCIVCGATYSLNTHHVVFRSRGGKDGPQVRLCGSGTTGCHGLAHRHQLHFRHEGEWQYFKSDSPVKYEKALEMEGWEDVEVAGE